MTQKRRFQRETQKSEGAGELEMLGHTIFPGIIEATVRIKAFVGDPPEEGQLITIYQGRISDSNSFNQGHRLSKVLEIAGELDGVWNIKKVEILDDCLKLTLNHPETL